MWETSKKLPKIVFVKKENPQLTLTRERTAPKKRCAQPFVNMSMTAAFTYV